MTYQLESRTLYAGGIDLPLLHRLAADRKLHRTSAAGQAVRKGLLVAWQPSDTGLVPLIAEENNVSEWGESENDFPSFDALKLTSLQGLEEASIGADWKDLTESLFFLAVDLVKEARENAETLRPRLAVAA